MNGTRRAEIWRQLSSREFDLLIIGGGINGAGVARDAALRGLRVALVEARDFAFGTSGRSTQLIHGGLRYLENAELGLVRSALRERATLLRIAPDLVHPARFLFPIYAGSRLPLWQMRLGLLAYDTLSGSGKLRHRRLPPARVHEEEPLLSVEGLRGAAVYWDAETDDAALTLANALDAERNGAVVLNHATYHDTGAVTDELTGESLRVKAALTVDARGPWHDGARRVRGSHLSVPWERLPLNHPVTFLSRVDARVMFLLPRPPVTVIGTTEVESPGDPGAELPSEDEVRYMIESAAPLVRNAALRREDVIAAWAGVRPLINGSTASPTQASREHRIEVVDTTIRMKGGKLTTYRSLAERVVNRACRLLGTTVGRCETAERPLPPPAVRTGADPSAAGVLATAVHEHALTLGDVLIRRARVAFLLPDQGREISKYIAPRLAELTGRSPEQLVTDYEAEAAHTFVR